MLPAGFMASRRHHLASPLLSSRNIHFKDKPHTDLPMMRRQDASDTLVIIRGRSCRFGESVKYDFISLPPRDARRVEDIATA